MTTQEKIDAVIERQYGNYRGKLFQPLKAQHQVIRRLIGDERFLLFLEWLEKENPRPKYQQPNTVEV